MGDVAANKDLVVRFYNALAQGDVAAVRALGHPDFVQHNPGFDADMDDVAEFLESRRPAPPPQFIRLIADDLYVVTLRRAPGSDGSSDGVNFDIFRVEDDRVAEQWDYQEQFPSGPPA